MKVKTDHVIVVLVALTVAMQVGIMFRQQSGRSTAQPIKDAPAGAKFETKGRPSKGSSDAKVAMIEFSDYECPFCARHATGVSREVERKFVETGKVKYVFANNPLPNHSHAKLFATAAICAGQQDHFWEMHDSLFSRKPANEDVMLEIAKELPLDFATFGQCLESNPQVKGRLLQDQQMAQELGLTGTPAFGIGSIDSQGQVSIEKLVTGAVPLEVFEKALNEALDRSQS